MVNLNKKSNIEKLVETLYDDYALFIEKFLKLTGPFSPSAHLLATPF